MRSRPITVRYLALGFGTVGGVVGFALQGPEAAVLWSLVGFFLGKSIQSTVRAVAGDRSANS